MDKEDEASSIVKENKPTKTDVFAHKNEETILYEDEDEFWDALILYGSQFMQKSRKKKEVGMQSWMLLRLDIPRRVFAPSSCK